MADADPQLEADGNQEPERPEWLPENFKTPEALVDSYRESQAKMNQETQLRQQYEQQVQHYESLLAAQQNQPQQQQPQPGENPYVLAYEQAMENGDYRTAMQYSMLAAQETVRNEMSQFTPQFQRQTTEMTEALGKQALAVAWKDVSERYPDIEQHRDKLSEVVARTPGLFPDEMMTDPAAVAAGLEAAYKIATYRTGEAPDTTAAKLAAQGLPGAAGRPPAPDAAKAEWEAIKQAAKNEPGRYW